MQSSLKIPFKLWAAVIALSICFSLTAVVALENADSDGTVTAVQEALDDVDYSSTHIALNYGEEAPFKDMLYAMMMMSANDAADCLAVYTAGSLENFSNMMNLKAEQIGAKNTHFVNAHGMPDEEGGTDRGKKYALCKRPRYA